MKKTSKGLTVLEIIITLAIAAGVLSLGIISLRSHLPKQDLRSSVEILENIIHRAQTEAKAKSLWTCIKYTANNVAEIWVDQNQDHGTVLGACGNSTAPSDTKIGSEFRFKGEVVLALNTNPGCASTIKPSCDIWFDPTGAPQLCGQTPCFGAMATTSCVNYNFQIIIAQPNLPSGTRAREVEISQGGIVEAVKPGEKGMMKWMWAKYPPNETGGCE